jgi:hypothetical protein
MWNPLTAQTLSNLNTKSEVPQPLPLWLAFTYSYSHSNNDGKLNENRAHLAIDNTVAEP